ncbi:PAS domain S-box protein [Desulfoscipio gibsoniae]|uniref:histidine kinase n=1 Tax=Desulfoscipio gibsoniae DSM 7213 TaxID=767817 RepID=R4KKP4_9FIRM|nr:PAS domain S-box protein [Desulfoscipio gibsoniae]AGL01080.1 PAS domain S-box [Desulfoscipio gibsoniae DSM 7213]
MKSQEAENEQLITENQYLRKRVAELETTEYELNIKLKELNLVAEHYQVLVENQSDLVVKVDINSKVLFVNQSYCDVFGKKQRELIDSLFEPLANESDSEVTFKAMENLNNPPYSCYIEHRAMTKNGCRWFGWAIKAILGESNNVIAIVGVGRDITERKKAEKELEAANQKLRDIIDFLPDATFVVDNDKRVIAWNRSIEEMTGLAKKDIIGKGDYAYAVAFYGKRMPFLVDFINTDINKIKSEVIYENIQEKGNALYAEINMPPPFNGNGGTLWAKASPLYDSEGQVIGVIESIRDITDRKRLEDELYTYRNYLEIMIKERTAELQNAMAQLQQEVAEHQGAREALSESEAQLSRITNNMLDLIVVIDTQGTIKYATPSHKKVLGYEPEDMLGKCARDFVHPDDLGKILHVYKKGFSTLSPVKTEYRCRQINGQYIWVESTAKILLNDSKLFAEVIICTRDITGRKQAEETLRLSEERFYKAFHSSPNPMAISSLEHGQFFDINCNFVDALGYTREEVIGHTSTELNIWEPQKRTEVINLLLSQGYLRNFENSFQTKSGKLRIGLLSAEIIEINGEKVILSIVNDITDLRLFEKEMLHLDKLNLVGEMAASIGHEIRNPMTTVRGFLQILRGREKSNKNIEYYDLMIEELDRANSIITPFLSLARNKPVDKARQNLNTVVKTLQPLLQADANKEGKYMDLELYDIPDLLLDEKEIRQLLLNFVRNGLEAMSPGSKLIIKTYVEHDGVILAVQDQGSGIAPETMDKLGTPFFTTKDNGTGLGLAVCYSIINRHNARIEVETGPSGTTFMVKFKVPTD